MQTPLMQKVAEVAPQKYDFIMKTAAEVRQSPFKDEIVGELDAIIKKANQSMMGRMGRGLGAAAAGIGATVATGIALNLAGDMFDAVKRGITKNRGYKAMLAENQDLKKLPAKDVQKAYSALHRFNPDFAMEPTVAGSFVRRQATLGEFDTKMLTDMVSSRKNLKDVRKIDMPSRLPWDSAHEQEMQGLEKKRLQQATDPEFQRAMREPDQFQQNLWQAQAGAARQQAKKLKFERRTAKQDLIAQQAADEALARNAMTP